MTTFMPLLEKLLKRFYLHLSREAFFLSSLASKSWLTCCASHEAHLSKMACAINTQKTFRKSFGGFSRGQRRKKPPESSGSSCEPKLSNLEILDCQVNELEKELEELTTKAEETMQSQLNLNWENRAKILEDFSHDFKRCHSCNSSEKEDQKRLVSSFKRYERKLRGSFREKMDVINTPIKSKWTISLYFMR